MSASSINLETYKGNVLLGGFVDTDAERAAAELENSGFRVHTNVAKMLEQGAD